ncbi:Hypothetical predicted protein [Paramuricea clavata]|uniref:Uncharacterized protein n=1 Tax=Paramuricea clavata TaxID=317549 RepID=A0A6S7I7U9_PARCT|nr:Hypothetical predicted protein [Paramuricea clavata]
MQLTFNIGNGESFNEQIKNGTVSENVYCGWVKRIKSIGIQRAFQLVSSDQDLMELLSQRGASEDYMEKRGQVEEVFKHQTVSDLQMCTIVPLLNNQTAISMDVQLFFWKVSLQIAI